VRKRIGLNFNWKYSESFDEAMIKPGFDDSDFLKVDVPHTNKELPFNYFNEKDYQFVCCYRKTFRLPAEAFENGRRVFLNFDGAANYAEVYVNGKFAGEHKGGYTPFKFDITGLVNKSNNYITVKLDCTERSEIPPFGFMVDYLCYGGIYREVFLEITEESFIEDVFIKTPNVLGEYKIMEADITFNESVSGSVYLR